jgi:hypothetical protein
MDARLNPRVLKRRRYRLRQKLGIIVAPVEIDEIILQTLITAGWLRDVDSADRRLVGEAIKRLLTSLRDPAR